MISEEKKSESAEQISDVKKTIKYDTRDYVLEFMVEKYKNDFFYIPSEYQRNFVWNDSDKCFFIESIMMGLPIPFMFFADTDDGRVEIVDGAQRTCTLVQFLDNELELNGLRVLTKSNGMKFKDLETSVQNRIKNTNIRVVFLEEGTTEDVRQEIFKRINVGGQKATAAEARRGSYVGLFKEFLEKCAKNERFMKLAPRTKLTEDRFEGFELVTRFFAYSDGFDSDFDGYDGNVSIFMDDYIEKMNKLCKNDETIIPNYEKQFNDMMDYAEKILGERGFRKTKTGKSTPRARFEALAIGINLALREKPDLEVKDISNWIDSDEFKKVVTSDAANNKGKLKTRINFVKERLING